MPKKPTPTALKVLRGNPGHRPLNAREPKPNRQKPRCPSWLPSTGKKAFRQLATLLDEAEVVTEADAMGLELLADAYAEWRAAREVVEELGQTYETKTQSGSVMIRPRPEVQIAADAWRRVERMLEQFGLTASARSKIETRPREETDPLADFVRERDASN